MSGARGSKALGVYALERLLNAVPLVLGVIVVNFVLVSLAPGDPVTALIGEYPAPPDYVERVREQYGLDAPLPERLVRYLGSVVRGDLGFSFANRQPVATLVIERLGRTLLLMVTHRGLRDRGGHRARRVGGAAAALRGRPRRHRLRARGLLDPRVLARPDPDPRSSPSGSGWLPAGGFRSIRAEYVGWAAVVDQARHMILPMLALSFRYMAITTRLTRASLLEVMNADYILASRARGLSERRVLWEHGLRAAALPIITVIGYNFGFIVAGSALVETVFGWPGVGRLMYDSIFTRDYPVLLGILLLVSVSVIVVNLLTDLAYALFDPRVRY